MDYENFKEQFIEDVKEKERGVRTKSWILNVEHQIIIIGDALVTSDCFLKK